MLITFRFGFMNASNYFVLNKYIKEKNIGYFLNRTFHYELSKIWL